jgi:hypothetical protein
MSMNRLIGMVVNIVLRRMTKGAPTDPNLRQAQKSLKTLNRFRRM